VDDPSALLILADLDGIPCLGRCVSRVCCRWPCLVVLAADPINRNLYYGGACRTRRRRRRGPLCADHQRFFSVSPGFCARCRFGALAAGPGLLKANLASLRLAIPVALIASTCAIIGAMIGLALPTNIVQICLGATILGICVLMLTAKKSEMPDVPKADKLSSMLHIYGVYREPSTGEIIDWKIHRTPMGLAVFVLIGIMAGMFGLGAGWANVPALNLLMGAPLKISVATSKFLLSITDTSAAWIYLNKGCVIPMMVVPSLVGIMLGSFVGVRLLKIAKPGFIRWMVIGILAFAGVKALSKGLGF